ncbi:NB-ARC domain-containing protein [Haliscomenobacter hydrossis]|uniref:NB-ARC domain protein n=1 Tax=Haliscomenobacter hydrossis (strain ATCC 27775 / DSM 1100 / LMG 10767 / O) TaxID=760192 RepID=F4KSP8_HALH1|nr:NB-ARC domain-containing protein [Haliscomenobacter hydrossis]AEE48012.1 NB-ARC domain protein [Haliscomenobacter hydrossis DSM 1100]
MDCILGAYWTLTRFLLSSPQDQKAKTMALPQYLSKIRQLIADDELPAALRQLHSLLENSRKLDEVIQQSGRFTHILKQIRLGTVHFEDATVTRNQISAALLELLSEIEKEGIKPELKAELKKAVSIVNSKNVASGTFSAGGDIKIGDTTTHVHNYRGVEIPRLLTPPPFLPEIFLGRTDDLLRIHELLFAPNGNLLLLVNGEGGVGKTSIASKYFHTYQEEYAHVAWVFKENSIADALLLLAMPLGVSFDEKWNTAQRLEVLLRAMLNLKKPCLLIIDNANELHDLNAYLPQLQRCSNFHVLLTTRISEQGHAARYKIEALPQDLALHAFKSHYKAFEASEEALFFDIYRAVQGNTLVLELLAKNLNNFNNKLKKRYLLADLKQELEQGLLKLSKISTVDTRYQAKGTGLRNESIEVIIMAMYDLGDLSETENQLLAVFAVLPAESIPFERLETLLPEFAEIDTQLLALAQKGWIEYNADTAAFKCSPVVQEVVCMKQGDLLGNCQPLIDGLIKELGRDKIHVDNYLHSSMFARYAEALINALSVVNYNLARLCEALGNFHREIGDLNKSMALFQKAQEILLELLDAEPENSSFKYALAIMVCWIGMTYRDLGDLKKALTFFEDYNTLNKELYTVYPQNADFKHGLAISYTKLGETHRDLGNLQQALTFFEEYNTLEKELYAAYPQDVSFKNNLAISYEKLGETHRDLGNLQQTLTFFELDIELSKELYAAYPQNVSFKNGLAISYEKLGQTHRDLGNLPLALTFFEHFNTLEKELYTAYPQNVSFKNGLAYSFKFLGLFYRDQKEDLQKAKEYFQQCYTLWQELSEVYPAYVEFSRNFEWAKEAMGEE